jgi:hypothetical protein
LLPLGPPREGAARGVPFEGADCGCERPPDEPEEPGSARAGAFDDGADEAGAFEDGADEEGAAEGRDRAVPSEGVDRAGGADPPERPVGEALEGAPAGADRGATAAALTGWIACPDAAATGATGGPKWTPGDGRPRGAGKGCARCTIGPTCRASATP